MLKGSIQAPDDFSVCQVEIEVSFVKEIASDDFKKAHLLPLLYLKYKFVVTECAELVFFKSNVQSFNLFLVFVLYASSNDKRERK